MCDTDDICAGFDDNDDADSDGTPDGCDGCPEDPDKVDPGTCGCGIPDEVLTVYGFGGISPRSATHTAEAGYIAGYTDDDVAYGNFPARRDFSSWAGFFEPTSTTMQPW